MIAKPPTPALKNRIIDALNHLDAGCTYDEWIRVGMALSAYADEGLKLFDQWSSTSPEKYPGPEQIRKVFASFKPGKITVGTIFWMCKKAGHIPVAVANAEIKGAATSGSAPIALNPAAGGHQQSTSEDADRLWKSSWTPAHATDLPGDWDKGLNSAQKGTRRKKLERHRDTVRKYISSRLGPEHVDHWSHQIRIGEHGVMLVPMRQSDGELCGVQRIYLDEVGHKIERKMLGRQGFTFCPVPDRVSPFDIGVGPAFLVGEGWETVVSPVQAVGWPGISTHSDNGIVKWAKAQVEKAKSLTDEQKSNVPTAVILVDRDISNAGQKACAKAVRMLRSAGLKAVFALPPPPEFRGPHGGEKGSDWGDYSKEGFAPDVLAAHLALAIAHGDRDMPELPTETDADDFDGHDITTEKKSHHYNWLELPADQVSAPAQAGTTDDARKEVKTALQKLVYDYVAWLEDDKKRPFAPVLMTPTTGTGKSTAAKSLIRMFELRQAGGRVCVFVPDHAQAVEYEKEGFFHFYGRNPDLQHCGYCPAYETVEKTMQTHHISQAEVCRTCSHGYAWQIEYYGEGRPGAGTAKAAERVGNAIKILRARGLDPDTVIPCKWQTHLREAILATFVVSVSKSYSHNLTLKSLVIFDEHFESGDEIRVTLEDLDLWSQRNRKIIEFTQKSGDTEMLEAHQKAGELFEALGKTMAEYLGKTGAIRVDEGLLFAIHGILDAAKKQRKDDVTITAWEKLYFNGKGELAENPVRAAHGIAQTLKHGDGYVEKGAMIVSASVPIIERLAENEPTIVMDATPDPVMVDIVKAQGGRIVNAIAKQRLKIVRHPMRFWGLTPLKPVESEADIDRREREIKKYWALLQHHGEDCAYLFHKRAAGEFFETAQDSLGFLHRTRKDSGPEDLLGHWGMHHRAHNRWTGKSLVIVGSFYPPASRLRSLYQVSRVAALSAGASPENWPVWNDGMEMISQEFISEGTHAVRNHLPLPADPHIKHWLLSRITAETVQAIGRVRGANADRDIYVHIYGGVPLHGLWNYGLSVAEYADDPECLGKTRAEHMDNMREQHYASLSRVDDLAARLIAKGQKVTREAMADEVNAMLEDAMRQEESYLSHGGYNTHNTLGQMQMPRKDTLQEWIATRMPVLSAHLSTKGRNGALVRAAQSAARRFGEEMLSQAMDIAESIMKSCKAVDEIAEKAWYTIENDSLAMMKDVIAARLALETIGRTEGVPVPWDETGEVPVSEVKL